MIALYPKNTNRGHRVASIHIKNLSVYFINGFVEDSAAGIGKKAT
jgi:hypothetical protein